MALAISTDGVCHCSLDLPASDPETSFIDRPLLVRAPGLADFCAVGPCGCGVVLNRRQGSALPAANCGFVADLGKGRPPGDHMEVGETGGAVDRVNTRMASLRPPTLQPALYKPSGEKSEMHRLQASL